MLEAILFAFFFTLSFGGGFATGIFFYRQLADSYKRNIDASVARARQQAYEEAKRQANSWVEKKSAFENQPISPTMNVHERNESFEESLERIYPNDETLKEQIRRQREVNGL